MSVASTSAASVFLSIRSHTFRPIAFTAAASNTTPDNDDDGSGEKIDVIEDSQATDPIQELNQNDLLAYMTRSLTPKERFIIEQYYRAGHSMREIGEMLNLTESRVCQIHSNVMERLKALLGQKSGSLLM